MSARKSLHTRHLGRLGHWSAGVLLAACALLAAAAPQPTQAAGAVAEASVPAEAPANAAPSSEPAITSAAPAASDAIGAGSDSKAAEPASSDNFDFFADKPVESKEVVELPPEKSKWLTVGGPIALVMLFFLLDLIIWWLVPFNDVSYEVNLRKLPPAVKRGMAMAVVMFGIAFTFGALEINYQLNLHGSAEAYFAQMTVGKLIAFTHAHLFGFTTSFFIVGIPFSLQFNHLKSYQWVFPIGLASAVTDVVSWWGIKFVSPNFEWVSMFCGVLFSVSYLWMLIGLLRVLLFPEVIWASDKDKAERLAQRNKAA